MKRDMDLIRLLLLDIEGEDKPDMSGYTEDQIVYQDVFDSYRDGQHSLHAEAG